MSHTICHVSSSPVEVGQSVPEEIRLVSSVYYRELDGLIENGGIERNFFDFEWFAGICAKREREDIIIIIITVINFPVGFSLAMNRENSISGEFRGWNRLS